MLWNLSRLPIGASRTVRPISNSPYASLWNPMGAFDAGGSLATGGMCPVPRQFEGKGKRKAIGYFIGGGDRNSYSYDGGRHEGSRTPKRKAGRLSPEAQELEETIEHSQRRLRELRERLENI